MFASSVWMFELSIAFAYCIVWSGVRRLRFVACVRLCIISYRVCVIVRCAEPALRAVCVLRRVFVYVLQYRACVIVAVCGALRVVCVLRARAGCFF